ncbi:hypothetical protein M378DRAFT_322995 [Amanita muscaria Koide BX008]|uniref:Alpha/beta hydrolase fold-3 domain-containing protein n=1 Tax=Amanita muscaria (strain Koide BX008) TaxID=946122 RepID=A0A0C2XDV8_AMAMK|nr:hypothetical protein M378DRAFT_322995 [Amanita muscaria Koide BX008]
MTPLTGDRAPRPIWSSQPYKSMYIVARVSSLLILVPFWFLFYLLPFQRPRRTWTLRECVMVLVIRWMMPLNAICGLSPMSTDKTYQIPDKELKETRGVWITPVDKVSKELVKGPAEDGKVRPVKIPGYIWPKRRDWDKYDGLVGLFFHGGGYMMGNATETFGELAIVRELHKTSDIKMFLSVDYRLCHEACHPGQLLDALSGYTYLIHDAKVDPSRIVFLGACAGGHLALMLARYLYDTKVLPMPVGIMLFSPMIDLVIDGEIERSQEKPRPNTDVDCLNTSFLANLRLIGHHPQDLLWSTLLSPNKAPPRAYADYPSTFISVGELEAWRRENEQLCDLMIRDGVDVTWDVQEDAVHDFWGFGDMVPTKRARDQVAKHAVEWIHGLLNKIERI